MNLSPRRDTRERANSSPLQTCWRVLSQSDRTLSGRNLPLVYGCAYDLEADVRATLAASRKRTVFQAGCHGRNWAVCSLAAFGRPTRGSCHSRSISSAGRFRPAKFIRQSYCERLLPPKPATRPARSRRAEMQRAAGSAKDSAKAAIGVRAPLGMHGSAAIRNSARLPDRACSHVRSSVRVRAACRRPIAEPRLRHCHPAL